MLRSIVVGREAWLYRGTSESTQNSCVLWSLMQSCRSLRANPAKYLAEAIEAMALVPRSQVHEWTPRAYAAREGLSANHDCGHQAMSCAAITHGDWASRTLRFMRRLPKHGQFLQREKTPLLSDRGSSCFAREAQAPMLILAQTQRTADQGAE